MPVLPAAGEADAGGSQVQGHQGQISETLSQTKNLGWGSLPRFVGYIVIFIVRVWGPKDRGSVVLDWLWLVEAADARGSQSKSVAVLVTSIQDLVHTFS